MDLGTFHHPPPLPPPSCPPYILVSLLKSLSSARSDFPLHYFVAFPLCCAVVCLPASTRDWSSLVQKCPAQFALLNWPCLTCPAQLSEPHTQFGRLSCQLVAYIGNVTKRMSSHNNIHQLTYSSISTNSHKHSTSMLLTITKPPHPCQLMTSNWVTVTIYSGLFMLLSVCSPTYSALTATAALCSLLPLIRQFTCIKRAPVLQRL